MSKKILILGGGYAGVEAALTLSKHKKKTDIEITVIDKNDYHTLLTELHEVAGNRISEEGIIIPFERIFRYTPVRHVVDEITEYDLANKTLRSSERTYQYDHLVLAIGSTPNFYNVPGLHEHAFTLWSYEDALRIREHIKGCFAKARGESDPAVLQKLLTFTVAGAGFTGVEMIGELAHWVRKLCQETGIPRKAVRLIIVDALPRVLHVLSEQNSAKVMRTLAKLGVEVMLQSAVKDLTADGFYANDTFIPCGTLIWAAGIRAAEDVDCMSIELGSGCRIQVDQYGRTQYPDVYAAGDIAALLDETGCPYPAMVENAIQSAHGAAMNILRDIRGQQPQPIQVNMHGVMVSIGNYAAVSEIMGKSLPSWLSVVMKFFVNMHYLWEIVGFSGVANYLHHEILHRRQRKRLIEAHYSKQMQTWWLVPLRVFLGAIWLYEGLKKLGQGWLQSPKLSAFFKGANDFYANIIYGGVSSATGQAADAVSAATGEAADAVSSATGEVGEVAATASSILLNWDWAWLKFWAVDSGEVAFKIHFTPMQWVVDNWLLHSSGTQMFFQWAVVLAEIIIGLCLITGTLTFLASAASVGLQAGFVLTTGLYLGTWWMLFAGFAMMGGAGRAFGVDHYLLPYLNNYWERIWKARRWTPWFDRALARSDR